MPLNIVRRLLPEWGTTYGPPGERPFPTVMILHGSEGALSGWSHRNAVLLAAHGFLAFPFGYSQGGNVWNAGSIHEVSLDRSVAALEALRGFDVSSGRVGLYGVSRGAEHALLLTSLMAREAYRASPMPWPRTARRTVSAARSMGAPSAMWVTPAGRRGMAPSVPGSGAGRPRRCCPPSPSRSSGIPARCSSAMARWIASGR